MKSAALKKILVGLVVAYFLYCVYYLFINLRENQWDFRMQYVAAKIFAEGKNPYDVETVKAETGNTLWYAYPPATLWFYRLFTLAKYDTAYKIFLILKAAAVIALVLLWQRKFLVQPPAGWFYLFCLLAFNSAVFLDMRAGNINMFEQLFLWLGFYFFIQRRLLLFCLFILLAASFKMTPHVFLFLLLATPNRKTVLYLFGSLAVFMGYLLIQYVLAPDMFLSFVAGASDTVSTEWGVVAPSTIGILKDACDALSKATGLTIRPAVYITLYYVAAVIIALITSCAFFVLNKLKTQDKEKIMLFLFCLLYALVHPRMKDYAYVLLIAPSFFIIARTSFTKIFPFLFILPLLSVTHITLPGLGVICSIMVAYYSLIIAYLVWALYLYEIFSSMKQHRQSSLSVDSGV